MDAQNYPFHLTHRVIFQDLDAMGHVNNVTYFVYMETARIEYIASFFEGKAFDAVPIVAASAACEYRSAAFYGEMLHIGVGISRFGTKSFDMLYRINTADGRLVATGKTVQVTFDFQSNQTIPIPETFKANVLSFQGDWFVTPDTH